MKNLHSALLHAAPVAVTAVYGAWWIAAHAGGGRGSAHTLWQSLALAETLVALLLRHRKPVGALAGILAAYLLVDLDPLLLPGLLFALFHSRRHPPAPHHGRGRRHRGGDRRDALSPR
jgi:hypothetical protein